MWSYWLASATFILHIIASLVLSVKNVDVDVDALALREVWAVFDSGAKTTFSESCGTDRGVPGLAGFRGRTSPRITAQVRFDCTIKR